MTHKKATSVVALLLAIVMMFSAVPMSAFASIPNWDENNNGFVGTKFGTNGYYNVISKKEYTLVPGAAMEYEIVLNNDAGTRRQVIHVIEVDPSNPDVSIVPGYNQIDKDLTNEANWSHKELTEMAKYYEENLGYNIVGGMNTDLYYDTYAPRILVYNGENLSVKGEYAPSSSILYVLKDAEGNISCDVKAFNRTEFDTYLADGVLLHAVGVSFGMVVKDGELVSKTEERTSSAAARSMVGIKEDGTLVICMNDGRGANNSVGFCNYEEGEAMLALGCKWAANCDGGGSSTFLTKRAGEDTFTMRSVPCDGAQRPTAHGIFVASNVAPTGVLDTVNINSNYDIFAPKTSYTFGAEAIDTHGYAMAMPADAEWTLSDSSFGTITNGKFVSNGKKGEVKIQVTSGGQIVGEKTITVADPETFTLSATSTVVPYSTADKVRTITLPIVAMTGEANVYVDTNAVSVALSDSKAGTLEGFRFTATSDTSISGVNITITYGTTALTYVIEFGKGSEIVFDFEDGDVSDWMGFDEAKQWNIDNGISNTLTGSSPIGGQFSESVDGYSFLATKENGGQVRNGQYALGFKLDNTDADFANWTYNIIYYVGGPKVLRDVANGQKATAFGMWVYIPEGAAGLAMQLTVYKGDSKESATSGTQMHFYFTSAATGNKTNLNSAKEEDIPESRWVYASVDLTGYNYVSLVDPTKNQYREPTFIRTYIKPTAPMVHTFYFDDFTLDYSSAVDDRVLPTITAPTYSTSDTAVSLENGASITGNKFAFSATVADDTALDLTSGKIWVDGVEVKAAITGNMLSSKEDVTLASGTHTVTFEVKDEMGNPRKLTRTFTVSGDAAVTITGHNDSGETPKAQSVYYVNIKAANVSKLVATLKLNNANTWETKGAIVANGYKATFSYNEVSELLTVTVELVDAAKAAGDVLVSIPVRVWTFDRYNHVTNTYVAVDSMGNKPVVNIECDVVYGNVTLTDKTSSPFGGSINVETELTTISSPYHVHDAELTVLNKKPSVTEVGYENRTYCETCKSVVDWGTILEKLNHNYAIVGNQFVCTDDGCGEVYESGTGVFEMNGDLYYSINNELKTGWQTADVGYCYAGTDYKLYIGEKTVNGIKYTFDANGSTLGAWTTNSTGTRYSYGPGFYARTWMEIDGKTYYFGSNSYMYTGIRFVKDNPDTPAFWYIFAEDGTTDKSVVPADGVYEVNGDYYIVKDGETQKGLHYIDGAYYLGGQGSGFDRFWCVAVNTTTAISSSNSNGLIPSGTYTFGADGKMVINHGPVGDYFYDENGFMVHAYKLVAFDGNYYYVNDGHKLAKNKTIYLSASELTALGLDLPSGEYEFDADGKMIIEEDPGETPDSGETPDPVVKNGADADGYFYIDGVKQLAYQLIKYEGSYYFINDAHKYVANKTVYLTAAVLEGTNFQPGYYNFGADGKMILKNGADADGYFYLDGVKQLAYQLIKYEGSYYFINDAHKYAANKTVYLTAAILEGTNFQPGYYNFGADGKMILA